MKRTKSMVYRETVESRELELCAINDGDLYRKMISPFIERLKKRYKAGTYDKEKAIDYYFQIATEEARIYNKKYGSDPDSCRVFNVQSRFTVAVNMEKYYFAEDVSYEG